MRGTCGALAALVLGWAAAAGAAVPVEEKPWPPVTAGGFVSTTGWLNPPSHLVLQPLLFVGLQRGTFDERSRTLPMSDGSSALSTVLLLYAEYGIVPRLSVGAQPGLVVNRREEAGSRATSVGAVDPTFFARVGVQIDPEVALPETSLLLQAKAPVGKHEDPALEKLETDLTGNGAWELTVGLNLTKAVWPVIVHSDLLFTQSLPARVEGEEVEYGPAFGWSLAVEWPFLGDRLALLVEASGRHQGRSTRNGEIEDGSHFNELVLGFGLEVLAGEHLQFLAGYQRTVWGTNAAALDTIALTVIPTF